MARIKIILPDNYIFSTEIPVRSTDINRGGHMGWNHMFNILDEARIQFWGSIDYSETENARVSNIMADAGINYKKQVFYGQTLRVEMAAAEFTERGFDLVFRVSDAETGEEVARAKTGMLCFDYQEQKITRVPDDFRKRLQGEG
ncbi:MAG: acyl-CoA thioesterase [Dehalococcoidales bacterium]|nr:MAG: acyl-CoA thioesterase [Dehalococcoidales bacterium]